MKATAITSIVLACLVTAGCDSGSSGIGGSSKNVNYEFTPEGGPNCKNPTDVSNYDSNNYISTTCVWHCAEYKGKDDQYVSLTFKRTDGAWDFSSEYVTSGICD